MELLQFQLNRSIITITLFHSISLHSSLENYSLLEKYAYHFANKGHSPIPQKVTPWHHHCWSAICTCSKGPCLLVIDRNFNVQILRLRFLGYLIILYFPSYSVHVSHNLTSIQYPFLGSNHPIPFRHKYCSLNGNSNSISHPFYWP